MTDTHSAGHGPRLLAGRVAVVTGGGAGIGAAIVRRLAAEGASVDVAEIDRRRGEALAEAARGDGLDVHVAVVDVRDDQQVGNWAKDVLGRRGQVDVLVNNVGDYVRALPFRHSTPEHWDELHNVNLRHVFVVTRAFVDGMVEQGSGSIVHVHSVEGMRGYPADPVYGAYKAAVAHFTTCLAGELGRKGIRVNAIAPDLTQTPQVDYLGTTPEDASHMWESWAPVGRIGTPDDQADVALFLASDQSSFVTGHTIPVDGGTHASGGWFWSPDRRRFTNRPLDP